MKLDFENVKEITKGLLTIKEGEDGYIHFDRFTSSQIEYFEKFSDFIYQRSLSNCSTFFEFKTTAESVSFDFARLHERLLRRYRKRFADGLLPNGRSGR